MSSILADIKKELKGYKSYWDLPRHLKIKLEKKSFDLIKKGKSPITGKKLGERVDAIKKEYANEHPIAQKYKNK